MNNDPKIPVIQPPMSRAWPTDNFSVHNPLRGRTRLLAPGALTTPPNSTPTFSAQPIALFNGSKVFDVDTSSIKILDRPSNFRNLLHIRNSSTGTQIIFVEFGDNASSASTLRLDVNEQMLYDVVVPQDDIYVIASAAGGRVSLMVSTITLPL